MLQVYIYQYIQGYGIYPICGVFSLVAPFSMLIETRTGTIGVWGDMALGVLCTPHIHNYYFKTSIGVLNCDMQGYTLIL